MSPALPALLLLLGAAPPASKPAPGPEIQVLLLSRQHPRQLRIEGVRKLALEARGDRLFAGGSEIAQPLRLDLANWALAIASQPVRRYRARLAIRARGGELLVVGSIPLEEYVAAVVASETEVGTPLEALKAQAVVTRSYALAQPPRHEEASACDLAHCQLLLGYGAPAHLAAARKAALATRGEVLRLGTGEIAIAPFHAACGGHTAEPREVFAGDDRTGSAAVADPGCSAPWAAIVPAETARAAASESLGAPARLDRLSFDIAAGGYVTRVVDRATGRSATGESFIRALGARVGYGRVPSPRFSIEIEGAQVRLRGAGIGHGVGLCQRGAARLALQGAGYREILGRFFPRARLDAVRPHDEAPATSAGAREAGAR
jgi:stage II sporulation protein D